MLGILLWLLPLEFAVLTIVTLLFLTALAFAIFWHVAHAHRKPSDRVPHEGDDTGLEKFSEKMKKDRDWFRAQQPETLTVYSADGTLLRGHYLPAKNARGTAILLHGFRSEPDGDFGGAAACFQERGFHVLLPIQRAHAGSEGNFIGFGLLERYDIQAWANAIAEREGPDHPIILYGVSMGATTVMMASALTLPDSVKALIADCGYTSPKEMFRAVMQRDFTLPEAPLLSSISAISHRLAGYRLSEYSTLDAMRVNTRPILFIHGRQDDLVPPEMSIENFSACRAPKRLLMVDARHAGSYFEEPQLYLHAIDEFLTNCAGIA